MKTKLDIISGFLGAGKTTIIKKIIEEKKDKERIVVVENDFGEISIDTAILRSSNIEVKEINSGCICCSLRGMLMPSIMEMIESFHPDRIIIEPTGIANLSELVQLCSEKEYSKFIGVNIIAAVVDSKRYFKLKEILGDFFTNQISNAKTIFISKTQKAFDTFEMELYKNLMEIGFILNMYLTK